MTSFTVYGPHPVPLYRGKSCRIIRAEEGRVFFRNHASLAARVGCYVFAMGVGRGVTPIYVGKTRRNFGRECFEPHKLGKYNQCLADYERGKPLLYFVLLPVRRGRRNTGHIEELETFLIQTGVGVNPNLLNVQGTKLEEWRIRGVIRSAPGRPASPAASFKSMMKL